VCADLRHQSIECSSCSISRCNVIDYG
jgi:hypothetical protein